MLRLSMCGLKPRSLQRQKEMNRENSRKSSQFNSDKVDWLEHSPSDYSQFLVLKSRMFELNPCRVAQHMKDTKGRTDQVKAQSITKLHTWDPLATCNTGTGSTCPQMDCASPRCTEMKAYPSEHFPREVPICFTRYVHTVYTRKSYKALH